MNLFLDDERLPEAVSLYMPKLKELYDNTDWTIVRNYEEFVAAVDEKGVPKIVSFDHDLAKIHYDPTTWTEGFEYYEKTGYDCAKYLIDKIIETKAKGPRIIVHSMNPVGAKNIINLFLSFNKNNV